MTAQFTVLLPHKWNPRNTDALMVCVDCLMRNTRNEFILIVDVAEDGPLYQRVNRMVQQASTEYCVYWASDFFAAPDWDAPMLDVVNAQTFVTNVLVEPGIIAMHHMNLHRDYGVTPEGFDRGRFEADAVGGALPMVSGPGWYAPYMFPRAGYLEMGGLETNLQGDDGFTDADMRLFARWENTGHKIIRARSWTYHLQRYSDPKEQMAEKRVR